MHATSPILPAAAVPPIGGDELAEGLMLVRASTLKVVRLQLAMERGDRRVALEAVDDLVTLDRRLEDYVAHLPALRDFAILGSEIEAERSALHQEKLTLVAGISNGNGRGEVIAPVSEDEPFVEVGAEPGEEYWPEALDANADYDVMPKRRWWPFVLIALILIAAGAVFFLDRFGALPDWSLPELPWLNGMSR